MAQPRLSREQANVLIEFMEQHPHLERNVACFTSSMGAARKAALWAEVSAALNALGPAVKVVRHWRKYWSRLCCDGRKLARDIERKRRRTGEVRIGGVEGRVLEILDRTGPDSDPIRIFTEGDEEDNPPRAEEAAAADTLPVRLVRTAVSIPQPVPTMANVSVGSQPGTSGTAPHFVGAALAVTSVGPNAECVGIFPRPQPHMAATALRGYDPTTLAWKEVFCLNVEGSVPPTDIVDEGLFTVLALASVASNLKLPRARLPISLSEDSTQEEHIPCIAGGHRMPPHSYGDFTIVLKPRITACKAIWCRSQQPGKHHGGRGSPQQRSTPKTSDVTPEGRLPGAPYQAPKNTVAGRTNQQAPPPPKTRQTSQKTSSKTLEPSAPVLPAGNFPPLTGAGALRRPIKGTSSLVGNGARAASSFCSSFPTSCPEFLELKQELAALRAQTAQLLAKIAALEASIAPVTPASPPPPLTEITADAPEPTPMCTTPTASKPSNTEELFQAIESAVTAFMAHLTTMSKSIENSLRHCHPTGDE
ncbi:hypothetical protein HPB52_003623 [Rhipicephalus sanguineus]|uniref:Regulatory protein zeste n=1 Tax=Rhipicephalus sanguineus TaxID=34632 RepID=A0A9D4PU98_RHISA|nr:hypothetical protein HPB52_003623 [Rhipicephalus sanguineus]